MTNVLQQNVPELVEQFRAALEQCEDLYRDCGLECVRNHAELVRESPREFLRRMIDLHRGLLVKVFIEIANVDWHWSPEELLLAQTLFEHVWDKHLKAAEVRQTLENLLEEGVDLQWGALVGPFERLAPLRERASDLQTVVLRIANLVAKVDGRVKPEEARQLAWIQAELRRHLERIPLARMADEEPERESARHFVQQLPAQAAEVRARCRLQAKQEVPVQTKTRDEQLADTLAELDALIGLDLLKREIRGLVNFLWMQQVREQFALPTTTLSLHCVFRGNPGTGKTTVARLLGRIFGAMGILAKGHLIETDRSGLVAEYAGQTGPKTNRRIDEALDGVLFIDEAYSLFSSTGDDPFGAEAVQTLLKRMEDNRDRLVVVLAGYPRPLDALLKSNPGLSSRFARQFTFPDYSAGELGRIFETLCRKSHYELPALTRAKLLLGFESLLAGRDEHFGNGRLARNVFERSINRLANRIAGLAPLTKDILVMLQADDIEMEGVPEAVWSELDSEACRFRVTCPGCNLSASVPQTHLGQTVRCKRCDHEFQAAWGEVSREN